ncbi:hypothetical protein JB92DRAFT_2831915 [Gautieria morchelliformis]|nr:hypothetical protein JB92DRAFT_2831915 [Gautieria morchelliformis]
MSLVARRSSRAEQQKDTVEQAEGNGELGSVHRAARGTCTYALTRHQSKKSATGDTISSSGNSNENSGSLLDSAKHGEHLSVSRCVGFLLSYKEANTTVLNKRPTKIHEILQVMTTMTTPTGVWKILRPMPSKNCAVERNDDNDPDVMAQRAQCVSEAADEFRDAIARLGGSGEDAGGGKDGATVAGDIRIQSVVGRLAIAPSDSSSTFEPRRTSSSSTRPRLLSPTVVPSSPTILRAYSPSCPVKQPIASSRWKNEILISKDSAEADTSKKQMKKRLKKGWKSIRKLGTMAEPSAQGQIGEPTGKAKATPSRKQFDAALEDSDADGEIAAQEQQMKAKRKGHGFKAFEQQDPVALAFAGDNVCRCGSRATSCSC